MCMLLRLPDGAGVGFEPLPDVSSALSEMASDSSIPMLTRLLTFRVVVVLSVSD